MRIHELKEKYAGKSAKEILKLLGINGLPIDIKYIIREHFNIVINEKIEWEKLALDGSVYLNKNNYIEIWLNVSMPENRQNFTLAHELGHIVNDILPNIEKYKNESINDNYQTLYRNSRNTNSMESRANSFAADFLMPYEFIAEEAENISQTKDFNILSLEEVIKRMANRFRVSYEAMKWRLFNLGYINIKDL